MIRDTKSAESYLAQQWNVTPEQTLHKASKKGLACFLSTFLCSQQAPTEKNAKERQALYYAAKKGDLEVCQILVANGESFESEDLNGNTPYMVAPQLVKAFFDSQKSHVEHDSGRAEKYFEELFAGDRSRSASPQKIIQIAQAIKEPITRALVLSEVAISSLFYGVDLALQLLKEIPSDLIQKPSYNYGHGRYALEGATIKSKTAVNIVAELLKMGHVLDARKCADILLPNYQASPSLKLALARIEHAISQFDQMIITKNIKFGEQLKHIFEHELQHAPKRNEARHFDGPTLQDYEALAEKLFEQKTLLGTLVYIEELPPQQRATALYLYSRISGSVIDPDLTEKARSEYFSLLSPYFDLLEPDLSTDLEEIESKLQEIQKIPTVFSTGEFGNIEIQQVKYQSLANISYSVFGAKGLMQGLEILSKIPERYECPGKSTGDSSPFIKECALVIGARHFSQLGHFKAALILAALLPEGTPIEIDYEALDKNELIRRIKEEQKDFYSNQRKTFEEAMTSLPASPPGLEPFICELKKKLSIEQAWALVETDSAQNYAAASEIVRSLFNEMKLIKE